MSTHTTIDLLILVILLLLSAFFSSAETALTVVNRIRMQALAEEGNTRAAKVIAVTDNRPKMLSAILICNNVINLSASALSTTLAIRVFGNAAVGLATGVLTVLVIIFGEIAPKNMAAVRSEEFALRNISVISFLMKVLTPVIFIVEHLAALVVRLFAIDLNEKPTMTENELRALVDASEEDGVIESDERAMINNVVDLQDTYAREIMIPRIDMISVPDTSTRDDLIQIFREHRFTRMPVYHEHEENVIGIVNVKDLLVTDRDDFSLDKLMRTPYYTYETKNISDLLDEMRLESRSVVIVLDEYGNASGMLTMEDVLEEIVGEIHDEYKNRDTDEITVLSEGREYTCLGSADIDDLNELAGLSLESEDYDTIGGFVIEHSDDKLPKVGESIVLPDGTRMVVESVRKNRIMRVHVFIPAPDTAEETES